MGHPRFWLVLCMGHPPKDGAPELLLLIRKCKGGPPARELYESRGYGYNAPHMAPQVSIQVLKCLPLGPLSIASTMQLP